MLPCVSSSGSQYCSLGVESISAQVTLLRVTNHLLCFFTVLCLLTIIKLHQFTNYISMFTLHFLPFLLCSNSSSSCIFLWSTIIHFLQSLVPYFFIHTADLFRVNISVETYDWHHFPYIKMLARDPLYQSRGLWLSRKQSYFSSNEMEYNDRLNRRVGTPNLKNVYEERPVGRAFLEI